MANRKVRARQSTAPFIWFVLLHAYTAALYMLWAVLIAFRILLYLVIALSFVGIPCYTLASVSYFGMNLSAGQGQILPVLDNLATFFNTAYNEFVVQPYNNIQSCFEGVVAWYNITLAFVQAIISTIASAFGVDLFTFALRSDISELELLRLQHATAERLMREQSIGKDSSMARARIMSLAGRIARDMIGLGMMQRHERSKRLVSALCDILNFVARFFIAVLDLFGDFLLTLMSSIIDLFVTAAGSFSFSFIEAFILVSLTIILDLVDPMGCFHPLTDLPESLAVCICPHAYPNLASVPSAVYNIIAGCICPGVDLDEGPIAILKQCLSVNFLQDLLNFIGNIINSLGSVLSFIQSKATFLVGFAANLIGIRDEIEDILGDVEDAICSIPFVCRRSVLTKIEYVSRPGRSEPVAVSVNETTVVVLDAETHEEVYRYVRKSRYSNDEIDQMMDSLISLLRLTSTQLDDMVAKLQQIQARAKADKEAQDSIDALYATAELMMEGRSARGFAIANTLRGFMNMRLYTSLARASLFGSVFNEMFQERMLDALVGPNHEARQKMRDELEMSPAWCSGDCKRTYSRAISGITDLGRVYLAGLSSIRFNETTGQYVWWGHHEFQQEFARRNISVLDIADSVIRASEMVSDFHHAQSGTADEAAMCMNPDGSAAPCCPAEDGAMTVPCTEPYVPGFEASPTRATRDSQLSFSKAKARVVYRDARERGLREAVNIRAILDPATLPSSIEQMLDTIPNAADTILDELEAIDKQLDAFTLARQILSEHRASGTRSGDDPIAEARLRELRGALRKDVVTLRQQTAVLPMTVDQAHSTNERAVVFVGLTIVGASLFVFSVQLSAISVIVFAPVIAIVLAALLPAIFLILSICAEQVFSLFMTFALGGQITQVELVTPWIVKLGPYVANSYFQGFHPASIGPILDEALDIGTLELEYIAYQFVRKFTGVVPRAGFEAEIPDALPDTSTGLPLTGFVDSILQVLEGNPKEACATMADCSGRVHGCLCADGRTVTTEGECPGFSGRCQAAFYWYPKRLQEIDIQTTFNIDCEALGWRHTGTAIYEGGTYWERLQNRWTSAIRSVRFLTNYASRGVFISWIGLFGSAFGLVPFLSFIAQASFKGTFILNVGSVVTRWFGSTMISTLEPNTDLFLVGGIAETALTYFRFPNAVPGGDKGSPTSAEAVCFVTHIPQLADILYLILIAVAVLLASLKAGVLLWLFGVFVDFGLAWINFWFMLIHYFINTSLIQAKKMRILSFSTTKMHSGASLPEGASAEEIMRHAAAYAIRNPNSPIAREALMEAERALVQSRAEDPIHYHVHRVASGADFLRVVWDTRREWLN